MVGIRLGSGGMIFEAAIALLDLVRWSGISESRVKLEDLGHVDLQGSSCNGPQSSSFLSLSFKQLPYRLVRRLIAGKVG